MFVVVPRLTSLFVCAAAVIAACRTEPVRSTFAVGAAPPGNVVLLPIGYSHAEPAYWGAEWGSATPGDEQIAEGVNQGVIGSLSAMGLHVVGTPARPTAPDFDKLDDGERARVMHDLGVVGVVRVAIAVWGRGGRVTIAIATPASAYAQIATCKLEMFSNAAADVIEVPATELMRDTASCVTRLLKGER